MQPNHASNHTISLTCFSNSYKIGKNITMKIKYLKKCRNLTCYICAIQDKHVMLKMPLTIYSN